MQALQATAHEASATASAPKAGDLTFSQEPRTRKAVIGGGLITSPAVNAHIRQPQKRATRKAVIGGGLITPPAVFAHIRKTMAAKTKRPA